LPAGHPTRRRETLIQSSFHHDTLSLLQLVSTLFRLRRQFNYIRRSRFFRRADPNLCHMKAAVILFPKVSKTLSWTFNVQLRTLKKMPTNSSQLFRKFIFIFLAKMQKKC